MNITVIGHLAFALLVQIIIGTAFDNWWAGAALGAGVFIGREHAQAEYKYIQANGGSRHNTPQAPELGALSRKYWSLDSVLDLVVPVIGVICLAFVM